MKNLAGLWPMLIVFCVTSAATSSLKCIAVGGGSELYFVAPVDTTWGCPALCLTYDYGATFLVVDVVADIGYGGLASTWLPSTLHCFKYYHLLSRDGGCTWDSISSFSGFDTYASGLGAVMYCADHEAGSRAQIGKSTDWGATFQMRLVHGIPDSVFIKDICLGSGQGEVYVLVFSGGIYYSNDFGRSFSYQSNISEGWGIPSSSSLINGAEAGEFYIFFGENASNKYIFRCYDYGTEIQLVGFFPLGLGISICSPEITETPGELYFVAVDPNMGWGGRVIIYHTTDYGHNWTCFEHEIIGGDGIKNQGKSSSLKLAGSYPNPFNPTTTISYQLATYSHVSLQVYNTAGILVTTLVDGWRPPGTHEVTFDGSKLPSGVYVYRLQAGNFSANGKMVLMK